MSFRRRLVSAISDVSTEIAPRLRPSSSPQKVFRRSLTAASLFAASALAGSVTQAAVTHATPPVEAPHGFAHVTIYGASWCHYCKALAQTLDERGVPFDYIDIDKNAQQWAYAKRQAGTESIPVTSVARNGSYNWIRGADADAVEKAYNAD